MIRVRIFKLPSIKSWLMLPRCWLRPWVIIRISEILLRRGLWKISFRLEMGDIFYWRIGLCLNILIFIEFFIDFLLGVVIKWNFWFTLSAMVRLRSLVSIIPFVWWFRAKDRDEYTYDRCRLVFERSWSYFSWEMSVHWNIFHLWS